MVAYALIELDVTDVEGIGPYMTAVADTVNRHGGKYLVRAGATEVVEGSLGQHATKVVLEFSSIETGKAWYNSEEYQAILPIRTSNAKGNFVWVEGV